MNSQFHFVIIWNVVNEYQIVTLFAAKSVSALNAAFASYS